jgi:uncharacterized membrane protein YeaQ/YmgE (transglycosylase-associated protein family)
VILGLISWAIIGVIAGWIAGMVTGRRQQGCLTKMVVGIIGAFIGGALAHAAGWDLDDVAFGSILVAAAGASLFLFMLEAIEGRRGRRQLP